MSSRPRYSNSEMSNIGQRPYQTGARQSLLALDEASSTAVSDVNGNINSFHPASLQANPQIVSGEDLSMPVTNGTVVLSINSGLQPPQRNDDTPQTAPSGPFSFMPTHGRPMIPASINLSFPDLATAEDANHPRHQPPSSAHDVQHFKFREHDHIKRLMCAINSHKCAGPPPSPDNGKAKTTWTEKDLTAFQQWHKSAHNATRCILSEDDGRVKLEACSWALYEMIVNLHQRGVREDWSFSDSLTSCSARLAQVVEQLENYPIVRKAAIQGRDVEKFVSDPEHYAKQKVIWRRNNKDRGKCGKRGAEEAELDENGEGDLYPESQAVNATTSKKASKKLKSSSIENDAPSNSKPRPNATTRNGNGSDNNSKQRKSTSAARKGTANVQAQERGTSHAEKFSHRPQLQSPYFIDNTSTSPPNGFGISPSYGLQHQSGERAYQYSRAVENSSKASLGGGASNGLEQIDAAGDSRAMNAETRGE